ncbi:hypothetical protein ABN028_06240 [Actinopolymorpha sp. B17G11]|uniref:hypothetical protein n=1 Tax=Actinopolymorpha sp. B17G11 TaxID=3160861 RepID=UPI0032E37078
MARISNAAKPTHPVFRHACASCTDGGRLARERLARERLARERLARERLTRERLAREGRGPGQLGE